MTYFFDYPWQRNPRLIYIAFTENVSLGNLCEALEKAAELMDRATMPLHVVLAFEAAQSLPNNVLEPIHGSRMLRHEQLGRCIFVSPNALFGFVGQVISQDLGVQLEFAADEQDAWEFFNEMGLC